MSRKQRYRFRFTGALGDIVALTAVVRDFTISNPDAEVEVDTPYPDVFLYNPWLTNWRTAEATVVDITEEDYREAVRQSSHGLRRHFLQFFHEVVSRKTNRPCQMTMPTPEIFLSSVEKREPLVSGAYWVVFAGGKTDITLKHWDFERYQRLVEELAAEGLNLVQTGRRHDVHPPLRGVMNLVGQGGHRELFKLIYHSLGVICPITSGMHIAAALRKPCVVIAGGREEPWWEQYDGHRFLHTVGQLDCCRTSGCWKKTLAECSMLDHTPARQPLPRCLAMISVADVRAAVLSYYPNGVPDHAKAPIKDLTHA